MMLTCLLSVAAGHLSQQAIVTDDGATTSQAIVYYADIIQTGGAGDWTVWYNLMKITMYRMVPAGAIPLATPNILFKPLDDPGDHMLPTVFSLSQNYPNPFNPLTEIGFTLPVAARAKLEVFNTAGQRVATLVDVALPAGDYSAFWDGSMAASGVYLYRLTAGEYSETKKMVLLK